MTARPTIYAPSDRRPQPPSLTETLTLSQPVNNDAHRAGIAHEHRRPTSLSEVVFPTLRLQNAALLPKTASSPHRQIRRNAALFLILIRSPITALSMGVRGRIRAFTCSTSRLSSRSTVAIDARRRIDVGTAIRLPALTIKVDRLLSSLSLFLDAGVTQPRQHQTIHRQAPTTRDAFERPHVRFGIGFHEWLAHTRSPASSRSNIRTVVLHQSW